MFALFSKHPFHATFYSVFFCFVAFSAVFYCVFCDVLPVIVACRHARVCLGGGVGGGWGGVGGGMITFLFINVLASSFLTRFSLLQVTV